MASMLVEPDGIIMLTTLLQPGDFERIGLSWWYVGPRNGHVSLLSAKALDTLLSPLGLLRHSFNESTHLLARQVPWYARSWFAKT
jgi:2-polyprenyl-6-hydroxyphenyl methylase/3-demethylubiquinone-9 3-methyltransferase